MNTLRVLIVGGGLGGLALANGLLHGLERQGGLLLSAKSQTAVQLRIFERDAGSWSGGGAVTEPERAWRPQGYRIGLDPGGLRALGELGLGADIEASGIVDADALRHICVADSQSLSALLRFPAPGGGIVSRWQLHDLLRRRVADFVEPGKKLESARQLPDGAVELRFGDGTSAVGDVVIGADGVRSQLRQSLLPGVRLLDSGVTGLAGIVPLPPAAGDCPYADVLQLSSGCLVRLLGPASYSWLLLRYTDEPTGQPHIIWVLNHDVSIAGHDYDDGAPPAEWLHFASGVAARAHPQLHALIAATQPDSVLRPRHQFHLASDDVRRQLPELPARVALLGDAAHAMTTHRGQGANTAFADAADLCKSLLAIVDDPSDANTSAQLRAYNRTCATRGAAKIDESLSSTRSLHVRSPFYRFCARATMRFIHFLIQLWLFLCCRRS